MASKHTVDIESFRSKLRTLVSEVSGNEDARRELHGAIKEAALQLESPLELAWRLMMTPQCPAALMTLMQMGAIKQLVEAGKPLSAEELGKSNNADPLLIVRLLRLLTPMSIVKEIGPEVYEATPYTRAFEDPVLSSGFQFLFTTSVHSHSQLSFYFQNHGYRNPMSLPGPFQYTKKTSNDIFAWLMRNQSLMECFNTFMCGHQANRGNWFTKLPVEGHDIQGFHRAFPSAPGSLVLQDLAPVIGNIKQLDSAIIPQAHSFFEPQPIRGARAYYMRAILHNWSDEKCLDILRNIRGAMSPGYSKILINDFVLPTHNVPLYPAQLDGIMMAVFNAMERTHEQWTKLLHEAGFTNMKFHVADPEGNSEGLIEVMI